MLSDLLCPVLHYTPMSATPSGNSLLDELEELQNEVLENLDRLNDQVLAVLKECSPADQFDADDQPAPPSAEAA